METSNKRTSENLDNKKSHKLTLTEQSKPRSLILNILEESKKLENINRKIAKTSGHNIIKHLSAYKHNSEDYKFPEYSASNEVYQKKSERINSDMKPISDYSLENYSQKPKSLSQIHKSKITKKEFADVGFNSMIWPEESIIDDRLFNAMIEGEKNYERPMISNFKISYENMKIKSKIGEYRKFEDKQKRVFTQHSKRKKSPQVSTPWTYASNQFSIFYPKF